MEDDQILSRGYEKGWLGKQEAVRELLKRHPAWRPHIIWQRAEKLHLSQNISKRGQDRSHSAWSEHDNKTLLNFAGYKSPQVIAGMLHRSEAAVRCHLMLLGKSSRVHLDGFSRHRLAVDLHIGKKTVQRWIVEGLLEVRDPRITRESLDRLDKSGCFRAAQLHGPLLSQIGIVKAVSRRLVIRLLQPNCLPHQGKSRGPSGCGRKLLIRWVCPSRRLNGSLQIVS